ncbi:hypothetical protein FDB15_04055 [Clostridium botulinum]|uniref:hypothetical protein n=1 Tax=unclassified Clostridium TaxID=2614128 RepID=UPI0013C9BC87|nr:MULTISPECIES: hypothetical protein [unclassified Clostridium]NFH99478.1 hypothetical protein [Clostridium botulinum]NFI62187.1 hypothetical protein [Clostridium botulinum]NFJ42607.1 hypothetical protein [Clostridium botulinum]NFJ46522.1 hypothetical protein [Clostridium botulinum]NFK26436.1 hypothetical protein [Clostridium botulinum]
MNKEILYDLTSLESALESLELFTKVSKKEIKHFLFNHKEDDYLYEKFYEKYKIDSINLKLDNLYLKVIHVITNDDECKSIKKFGLLNLQDSIRKDTMLSRYLKEKGVEIDFDKESIVDQNTIYYKSDIMNQKGYYSFFSKEKNLGTSSRRLFDDYQIEGFLYNTNPLSYGGRVNERAEILESLQYIFNNMDIRSEWVDRCKCYTILFKASVYNFRWSTFIINDEIESDYTEDSENFIRNGLVEKTLNHIRTLLIDKTCREINTLMKLNYNVPPEDIIEYIEN